MPPNEPSEKQGQYDFIMNPAKPPKKPLVSLPSGKVMRIVFFGGGVLILIMLITIGMSALNGSSNAQNDRLITVAKTETEIARVADLASEKISNKDLLFLTSSVKLSVDSTKQDVVSALAKRGKKITDKQLATSTNPQNDSILTEGEQNGRFDEAYKALLDQLLANYQKQLKAAYDSGNSSEKQIMAAANEQVNLLNGQQASN